MPNSKPAYALVESLGLLRPTDVPEENFIEASKFVPEDEDIIVTTYPKCGTTWTQSILWLFTHDLQKCHNMDSLIFGRFMEFLGKEGIAKLKVEPRILKTHLPLTCFQWNPNTKYIFVVRNPFDCLVSFYHHTKAFEEYDFIDGDFTTFFELFIKGQVDWGDYFEHLASWYKVKDEPNVLFLVFEDMKTDLHSALKKIGNFLGGKYAKMVESEETVEKIVDGVNIKKMHDVKVEGLKGNFFRKGVIGDWKNYLTPEMLKQLDDKFEEYDKKYGVREIWKDYEDFLPPKKSR